MRRARVATRRRVVAVIRPAGICDLASSVPRLRGVLRTYFPALPRAVTTLQVGGLVNAFGNGITLPFLFIYLHNVRGIGLGVVGLIVGSHALASIVAGPVFGVLIDRFGGRTLLATALGILAAGYAMYPLVHEPWQGFVVAAITGSEWEASGLPSRR